MHNMRKTDIISIPVQDFIDKNEILVMDYDLLR